MILHSKCNHGYSNLVEVSSGKRAVPTRMARSREALCDAFLGLVGEGCLRPGADDIAERAGLSRRSLFHHFKDLAGLYDAAYELGMHRAAPLLKEVDPDLTLPERLAALVDSRCKFLEVTLPFHWELTARALVGPAEEQARRSSVERLREEIRSLRPVFARDLEHLSSRERSELIQSMAAAISHPTWGYLRSSLGLSFRAARGIVARSLRALLADAGVVLDRGAD